MDRLSGFIQYGHRFEVLVPTTIYEDPVAVINVYKGNKKVSCDTFYLKEMPKWDTASQALTLSKRDMNFLEKLTDSLVNERKPDHIRI